MPTQQGAPTKPKGTAAPNGKKPKKPAGTTDYLTTLLAAMGGTSAPFDMNAFTKQARGLASADINQQVGAFHTEQDRLRAAAAQRAQLINQAAQAASSYVGGIGENTARSYREAGDSVAAYAQGYGGELNTTANEAVNDIQRNLGAIGSQQQLPSHGQGLANVLYGLGGQIPANNLVETGQAFAAAQRQLPAATLGYGQQQAIGALGVGNEEANALNAQIAQVIGQRGQLQQGYLDSLVDAAGTQQDAAQDRYKNIFDALKFQQDAGQDEAMNQLRRDTLLSTNAYRDMTLQQRQDAQAALDAYRADQLGLTAERNQISRENSIRSANSRTQDDGLEQARYDLSVAKTVGFIRDKKGKIHVLPGFKQLKNGQVVKSSTASPKRGFTNSDVATLADDIRSWKSGITGTKDGLPVVDPGSQLNWKQAAERAITRGPATKAWQRKAVDLVNAEFGTPESIAARTVGVDKQNGETLTQAITHIVEADSAGALPIPTEYALRAAAKAYGFKPRDVRSIYSQVLQQAAFWSK